MKRTWNLDRTSNLGYAALVGMVALALSSCSLLPPDPEKEKEAKNEELDERRFEFLENQRNDIGAEHPVETLSSEQVKTSQNPATDDMRGKIGKIPAKQAQPPKANVQDPLHFYDDFVMLNGDEEVPVNLVFNSAPLVDVLPGFADILGFNFVADSDLKEVITMNIDQKMTRKDLWNTFDRMLNLAGVGVMVDGSLLRILPLSKLAQQTDARLSPDGSGELFYFPLKNTTAKDVIAQIKPFLGKSAVVVELTRPNAVMVADDRANMQKIKQLLEVIDQSGQHAWIRKVVRCENILPTKLTEELKIVLPVLGFTVMQPTDKTAPPGGIQVTGLDRLQLLVVSAANQEAINELLQWIDLLDSSDSVDQERVFVYKVRHNKAGQLGKALSVIYSVQGESLTIDTSTGTTKTESLNSTATATRTASSTAANRNGSNAPTTATGAATTVATSTDSQSSLFDTPVRIFADGSLNRLVIRTTPRTYSTIKALLDRLDVVPAQVLLQIMIVEVTLTESTQFGLEFSQEFQANGIQSIYGTNYSNLTPTYTTTSTDSSGTSTESTVMQNGFTYLLADQNNKNKFGYIRASAGNGNVKIISNPQMLVTSHTAATINVGRTIYIRTQSVTNTSSSDANVTSNWTSKDTGVILNVVPQVTSNDLISLEIEQTLSQVDYSTVTTDNPNPSILNRVLSTNMTIANGRTMVLGGLIQEIKNDNLESLPLINQIPIINRLIGSTDAQVERSEILVLVTGTIVRERDSIEDMISRYNDALRALNEFESKLGSKATPFESRPRIMTSKDFWTNELF